MSKVLITRSKLDGLATTISAKSGEPLPLTIAQMDAAVQGIETGGSTPSLQSKTATPTTSQQTVTPDTGYDGLSQVTVGAIPSQYIVPTGELAITANGTVDVSQYASASVNVPTSGGEQDSGDRTDPIRFFDYDGRLVASYKSVPSAMPDVPTHDRLTNGVWNYTLAQVAEQFDAVGKCDVGANYDTASGKTEIDVELDSAHLDPYLCVAVKGTIIVDWGDGSATDTITGTSWTAFKPTQHVYAQAGDYTISIDGAVAFYGNGENYPTVLRGHGLTSGDRQFDREYCNCVTAVRVADGSRIGNYAFNHCYGLQSVSIPAGVTSIGTYAFQYCYDLHSVAIPSSVTSIGSRAFQYCYGLRSVSIPSGVTSISSYTFQNCHNLRSVSIPSGVTNIYGSTFSNCFSLQSFTIPSGVTTINAYTFQNCYNLHSFTIPAGVTSINGNAFQYCYDTYEYHLEPTTPPTLGYNAFNGIVAGTVIYVPKGCLEAYQTASNWSKYASYMQEEA